jgi:hypothetical protein
MPWLASLFGAGDEICGDLSAVALEELVVREFFYRDDVEFVGDALVIAGFVEPLDEGGNVRVDAISLIEWMLFFRLGDLFRMTVVVEGIVENAVVVIVETRVDGCLGRGADRVGDEGMGEYDCRGGKAVNGRSLEAGGAQVAGVGSLIFSEDEKKVAPGGFFLAGSLKNRECECNEREEGDQFHEVHH